RDQYAERRGRDGPGRRGVRWSGGRGGEVPGGRATRGARRERPPHEVVEPSRRARERRDLPRGRARERRHVVRRIEGRPSRDALVEDRGEREHVGGRPGRLRVRELLGGEVAGRAADLAGPREG